MICQLCELPDGKKLSWKDTGKDDMVLLHDMKVCKDCAKWLDRIVATRNKYARIIKEFYQ